MATKLVKYISLLFALAALLITVNAHQEVFNFRFNAYALLSLATVGVNLGLLVFINRPRFRNPVTLWFSLYIALLTWWGWTEILVRSSADSASAIFWSNWGTVGWCLMPAAFIIFTYVYSGQGLRFRQLSGWLSVSAVPVVFLMLSQMTDLVISHDPAAGGWKPWGFFLGNGPVFTLLLIWIEAMFIAGLYNLIRFGRDSKDINQKKQVRLFVISTLIPLIGGSITDGFLPVVKIIVFPTATLLIMFMSLAIVYGIRRYGLFVISQAAYGDVILHAMNEAVVGLDADFNIRFINQGAVKLLGGEQNELGGGSIASIFSNQVVHDIVPNLKASMMIQDSFTIEETEVLNRQSGPVAVSLTVNSVRLENGEIDGYILVITDITLQKALIRQLKQEQQSVERKVVEQTRTIREEQAKFEASIQSLQLGFVLVNTDGVIAKYNQAAAGLVGGIEMGKGLIKIENYLSAGLVEKVYQSLARHEAVVVRDATIGPKFVSLFITPIVMNNQVIGAVLVLEDVTEQKVMQKSRDEFFSIASHELRTPLTAIRGNTSMIKRYYADKITDPDLMAMISDIHESSIRLIAMVNDFLDASRLEQGKMSLALESFSLAEVAKGVAADLQTSAPKGVTLVVSPVLDSLAPVYADKNKVKQVLYNLAGNALKFTQQGSVTLDGRADGAFVRVRVIDTGRGIAPDKQIFLFHKFQQAGESILTRDTTKGTGLGLYITRLLVKQMGGMVDLESSTMGVGSVFYFTLPVAKGQAAPKPPVPAPQAAKV